MPRPALYASNAERQRAYRERQKQKQQRPVLALGNVAPDVAGRVLERLSALADLAELQEDREVSAVLRRLAGLLER